MSETSLSTQIQCLNCGDSMAGSFCQRCGQEDKEVKRPFLYFLQEFLRVVFELDGRAYRTIYFLFTRPGFLATEYFAGRRVSYTPPLRLFLIISIGFFIIIGSVSSISSIREGISSIGIEEPSAAETSESNEENNDQTIELSLGETELEIDPDSGDGFAEENKQNIRDQFALLSLPFLTTETNQNLGRYMAEQVIENIEEAIDGPREFLVDSLEYFTFFILLMMPVLALVQKILFFFTKKFYVEHLILTMHNHAFLFVAIFLMMITGAIEDLGIPILSSIFGFAGIGLMIWMVVYLFLSLKKYFERGYFLTGVLFLTVTVIYAVAAAFGLAIFASLFFIL